MHPVRDVSLAMHNAPDVDVILTLYVEDEWGWRFIEWPNWRYDRATLALPLAEVSRAQGVLDQRRPAPQAFRACLRVLLVGKPCGDDRPNACERALAIGATPCGRLKSIFERARSGWADREAARNPLLTRARCCRFRLQTRIRNRIALVCKHFATNDGR